MSGQPLPGYNYFRNHDWFIFQYISDVAGTKIDDVTGKNRWQQHNLYLKSKTLLPFVRYQVTLYTLCHCPDRGAPGCTGVPQGHPDRNLSNHPHPNEILKRPCHPSGSPGCWGATPVADRGEPQWNLDSQVHTPMTISNSSRPGCTPMKISLAGRPGWTPVEILLAGVHTGGIF